MNPQLTKKQRIYLSGLLHDLGKFYQRADSSFETSKEISLVTRNNAPNICRSGQGGYLTHQHVIWTAEFIEKKRAKFPFLAEIYSDAAFHHKPQSGEGKLVQLADWWASGIDRSKEVTDEALKLGKARFKRQPIGNIFQTLNVNSHKGAHKTTFSLAPLGIDEVDFYPVTYDINGAYSQEQYKSLWDDFSAEFDRLPLHIDAFIDTLYFLLKKYLWRIPANTQEDYPVGSLFDHLKTTASIAASLADYMDERYGDAVNNGSVPANAYPLLLLSVDLSGIQKFLYNIAGKQAAKSLKGRSFYLQTLLDGVALTILQRTHNYYGHLVYSSGGKFFMLLPNTESVINELKLIENEIVAQLWDAFQGELFICFGWVGFKYYAGDKEHNILIEGIENAVGLGDLWQQAAIRSAAKKRKKFDVVVKERYAELFLPHGNGGESPVCAITGAEQQDLVGKNFDSQTEKVYLGKLVDHQIEIGKCLNTHLQVVYAGEKSFTGSAATFPLAGKLRLSLPEDPMSVDDAWIFTTLRRGKPDIMNKGITKSRYGFRYFGGTTQPHIGKTPKTFEQLCDDEPNNKLGILRMDVDSLGELFLKGFDTGQASFTAYSTLSGMLDLFFSGYLNTLRERPEFIHHITIIYSGGDDLFAVGRWDKIILFAETVQNEFKRFTARQDITLSAGIQIVGSKFPVAKAAGMAGEAEEMAKAHQYRGSNKNAISVLGVSVNFDLELPAVIEWRQKLKEWLTEGSITKGLLLQLLAYYEQFRNSQISVSEGNKPDLGWKWHLAYNLSRRSRTATGQKAAKALDEIKQMVLVEINENHFRFDAFALACRLAELDHKKSHKQ
ncbi:MAG: type III-A CRISPR-associated protein Cas10/Csm1 [Bacteroidales bacterium]|nr:type III-A CRISPR-associated protein Cas10/Csm1 [Bacteroidales bacterium]